MFSFERHEVILQNRTCGQSITSKQTLVINISYYSLVGYCLVDWALKIKYLSIAVQLKRWHFGSNFNKNLVVYTSLSNLSVSGTSLF